MKEMVRVSYMTAHACSRQQPNILFICIPTAVLLLNALFLIASSLFSVSFWYILPSMLVLPFILCLLSAVQSVTATLTNSNLQTHVDVLNLEFSFNPVKPSYWTGYGHHRRIACALSPDGKSIYVAYLDASETDVHVQEVDSSTFLAIGSTVTVSGCKEGLYTRFWTQYYWKEQVS